MKKRKEPFEEEQPYIMDGNDFINSLTDEEIEKLLSEELEPSFDIKQVGNTKKYEFNVKTLIYSVEVTESIMIETNKKILSVKFRLMNNPNAPHREDFQDERQYQVALQKSQIGITGTGNAQPVFKRVLGAIITHIRTFEPNYITFIGDENRVGLYNKIMKLTKKYVSFDYKSLDKNPIDNSELGTGEFWLEIL